MSVDQIEIVNAPDDRLEITLRGESTALIKALATGLPREVLVALKDALEAELFARKTDPTTNE